MAEATRVKSRDSINLKKGEFGYPAGHLGHLTDSQKAALVEFKQLVKEAGLFTEAKDEDPATHSDVTLL